MTATLTVQQKSTAQFHFWLTTAILNFTVMAIKCSTHHQILVHITGHYSFYACCSFSLLWCQVVKVKIIVKNAVFLHILHHIDLCARTFRSLYWKRWLHLCGVKLSSCDTKTRSNIKNLAWSNLDTVPFFKNPWSVASSHCKWRRRYLKTAKYTTL